MAGSCPVENANQRSRKLLEFSNSRRVTLIMQTELSECGLACLAMVADYHGYRTNLSSLRYQASANFAGLNLQQLIDCAAKLNLSARPVKCPVDAINKLSLPCIIHWDLTHFVVLTGVSRNQVKINDPAVGRRFLSFEEFSDHFTGVALELTPTASFIEADVRSRMTMSQLWSKLDGLGAGLSSLFALTVLIQLLTLGMPYYIQWVVDEVLLTQDRALLAVLAIGFTLLVLLSVVTTAVRSYLILRLSSLMNMQMGVNLLNHLLKLPLAYFEKRHIGDLVSRFGSLNSIREQLTTGFVSAIVDGLLAVAVLAIMLFYSYSLTLVVLAATSLYCLLRLSFYEPLRRTTEESIQAQAKEQSNFLENLRGIQTIKLFTSEGLRLSLWQNRYSEVINADIRLGKLSIGFEGARAVIFGVENVLVVYLAAVSVMAESLTVGMLLAFLAYKNHLTERSVAFLEQVIAFRMLRLHLDRISDIALEKIEADRDAREHPCQLSGKLELQGVSFRYSPDQPWILRDLNLTIASGQSLVITGLSGSGKTTLMKIMLGLLVPDEGRVLLDDVDIRLLGLTEYRNQIAAVMQDDALLSGSILDNISFFDPETNLQKVQQCARLAAIDQDIGRMTMGYFSHVGDMGNGFSGGQIQRLLLARALYKEPKILFLDEATSHLDSQNESRISKHVRQLSVTRILITHRAETIAQAERVVVLCNGSINEPDHSALARQTA